MPPLLIALRVLFFDAMFGAILMVSLITYASGQRAFNPARSP